MFLIFTQLMPSGEASEGTEAPSDKRMCMLRFSYQEAGGIPEDLAERSIARQEVLILYFPIASW